MKKITQIETNDGVVHPDEASARKHLDIQLGNALNPLSHQLAGCSKYSAVCELLDISTETFRQIVALRDELAAGVIEQEEI